MLNEINARQPEAERLEQSVIDNYCVKALAPPENNLVEGKIFEGVKSIKDLKERYRELSKTYDPDMGGKEEDMKLINKEYKEKYARLKDRER